VAETFWQSNKPPWQQQPASMDSPEKELVVADPLELEFHHSTLYYQLLNSMNP